MKEKECFYCPPNIRKICPQTEERTGNTLCNEEIVAYGFTKPELINFIGWLKAVEMIELVEEEK